MTSTYLLRLARLTLRLSGDVLSETDADARNLHAALYDLVRDLEGAPPPAPERRTITREEVRLIATSLTSSLDITPSVYLGEVTVRYVASRLGLTVEDAPR